MASHFPFIYMDDVITDIHNVIITSRNSVMDIYNWIMTSDKSSLRYLQPSFG